MNHQKLAYALRQLGESVYEIADALLDTAADTVAGPERPAGSGAAVLPAAAPASFSDGTPVDEPFESEADLVAQLPVRPEPVGNQGSEGMCPRHKRVFRESKFPNKPDYCTAKEDDPKWSRNGFCSINADNVQKWLRERAAA